jgi:hypothetical protein
MLSWSEVTLNDTHNEFNKRWLEINCGDGSTPYAYIRKLIDYLETELKFFKDIAVKSEKKTEEKNVLIKSIKENNDKISKSDVFLSLVTENYLNDPHCIMQLGLALMHDKPFYLLVKEGTPIPSNLLKIAVKSESFSSDEDIPSACTKLLDGMINE